MPDVEGRWGTQASAICGGDKAGGHSGAAGNRALGFGHSGVRFCVRVVAALLHPGIPPCSFSYYTLASVSSQPYMVSVSLQVAYCTFSSWGCVIALITPDRPTSSCANRTPHSSACCLRNPDAENCQGQAGEIPVGEGGGGGGSPQILTCESGQLHSGLGFIFKPQHEAYQLLFLMLLGCKRRRKMKIRWMERQAGTSWGKSSTMFSR